jgi:plastocyanin
MSTLLRAMLAALASSILLALPAAAGTLQVTVLGADGKPAADAVVLVQPVAAWPSQPLPEPALIVQKDIRFQPYVTVVPVGASVRFVNRDSFDHHVRSQAGGPLGSIAPAQQFEFRLKGAKGGNEATADLKLDQTGTIVLGCHIHGSMRGHIFVGSTPWAAVTDANGRISVGGVPEGQAELRLWHPDQLVDQAPQRVQIAASAQAEARLNFTPKRRPPPVSGRKSEYDN